MVIEKRRLSEGVFRIMTTSKPRILCLALRECTFTLAVTLAIAYQLVGMPSRVLAQRVDQMDRTGAGKSQRRSGAPACIEVRSVIPDAVPEANAEGPGRTVTYGLRYTDFDRLLAAVPSISKAVPIREIPKRIRHLENVVDGRVVGTTREYAEFDHLEVARGRFISDTDNAKFRDYAVLGSDAAKALFPTQDPVGQKVDVGSDTFKVVGVARRFSTSRQKPQDSDKDIYIPVTTSKVRYGYWIVSASDGRSQMRQLSRIIVQRREGVNLKETARLINSTLKPFHPRGGVEVVIVKPEGRAR